MNRLLGLGICVVLLAACAGAPGRSKPLDARSTLEKRVRLYWEARQKNDWKAVRSLVDPELREQVSAYLDRQERGAKTTKIVSWRILSLSLEGETALVATDVSLLVLHPLLGGKSLQMDKVYDDRWVLRGGEWYLVVVQPSLGEALKNLRGLRKGK